jgi:hypothetical protein
MRTTLTLEDELAERLKRLARTTGQSFKEVVNSAIRRGLSIGDGPPPGQKPFRVEPKACGFRAGVDPTKLNQLYDELELAEQSRKADET